MELQATAPFQLLAVFVPTIGEIDPCLLIPLLSRDIIPQEELDLALVQEFRVHFGPHGWTLSSLREPPCDRASLVAREHPEVRTSDVLGGEARHIRIYPRVREAIQLPQERVVPREQKQ